MAIPGFGLANADSKETGGNIDILELPDGTNLQQFIRRTRANESMQVPVLTAWGIATQGSVFPDTITLSVVEEAVPHEKWENNVPNLITPCVSLDACLIFRARATLSISGKAPISTTIPTSGWTSAIGGYTLASAMSAAGLAGSWIMTNSTDTQLRVDWHQFNREYQMIRQGSAGSHLLTPTLITGGTYGTYTFTWTWSVENFVTKSEAFQQP